MPQNLIRLKQLEQSEISGLMQNVISSNQYSISIGGTGINVNNISAQGGYFNNLFVNGQTVQPEIDISIPTGYLSGINYSGNYDGGYFIGRQNVFKRIPNVVSESIGKIFTEVNVGPIPTSGNISRMKQVAMSSDGKYLTAVAGNAGSAETGFIYISNNYGKNWYLPTGGVSGDRWFGVAMSSDGKYQSAIVFSGHIYTSDNYGINWKRKATNLGIRRWSALAMNSDGQYQTATVYNDTNPSTSRGVYLSSDYGNNWNLIPTGALSYAGLAWRGAAINTDGKYQSIVSYDFGGQYPGSIFISNDYGSTWTETNPSPINSTSRRYMAVGMSSFGKTQIACTQRNNSNDGRYNIFLSNDYGINWKGVGPTGINIDAVCGLNDDGSNIVACAYYGKAVDAGVFDNLVDGAKIYVSNNYGENWTVKETNRNWTSVAISNNSKYLAATVYGASGIFLSKTPEYVDGDLQIENLSANNVVYNTGDQTVSGIKTFINQVNISNLASIYPAASNFRRYIPDSIVTMGTAQPFTGFINYFPIILKKDAVNPNICVESTTLFGRNDTSVVVGIYTGAGFQGANLFYSGVINISTSSTPTGISRLSTNITLTKGGYLLASVVTGAANPISFRSVSSNAFTSFLGVNTGMGTFFDGITTTQSDWAPYESGVTINGTLPSTIGSGLWSRTIRSPLVCLEY